KSQTPSSKSEGNFNSQVPNSKKCVGSLWLIGTLNVWNSLGFGFWNLEFPDLVRPSRFVDLNVAAKREQADRRHRGCAGKDEPHHGRTTLSMLGTECCQ